jgi:hypothetical protein
MATGANLARTIGEDGEIADVSKVKQKVVDLDRQQIKPLVKTVKPAERSVPYSEWVEHRQELQVPIELKDGLK